MSEKIEPYWLRVYLREGPMNVVDIAIDNVSFDDATENTFDGRVVCQINAVCIPVDNIAMLVRVPMEAEPAGENVLRFPQ